MKIRTLSIRVIGILLWTIVLGAQNGVVTAGNVTKKQEDIKRISADNFYEKITSYVHSIEVAMDGKASIEGFKGLLSMGPEVALVFKKTLEAKEQTERKARQVAMLCLGALDDKASVSLIETRAHLGLSAEKWAARAALARMGDKKWQDMIISGILTPNFNDRLVCLRYAGYIGHSERKRVLKPLRWLIEKPILFPETCRQVKYAYCALLDLGEKDVVNYLIKALEKGERFSDETEKLRANIAKRVLEDRTGEKFESATLWEKWWERNEDNFQQIFKPWWEPQQRFKVIGNVDPEKVPLLRRTHATAQQIKDHQKKDGVIH